MNESRMHRMAAAIWITSIIAFCLWCVAWLAFPLGFVEHPLLGGWTGLVLMGIVLAGSVSAWIRWRYTDWRTDVQRPGGLAPQNDASRAQPLWFLVYSILVPWSSVVAISSAMCLLDPNSPLAQQVRSDWQVRILCAIGVLSTSAYAIVASSRLRPRDKWGRREKLDMFRIRRSKNA